MHNYVIIHIHMFAFILCQIILIPHCGEVAQITVYLATNIANYLNII